jgi:hypothetical protein
MCNGDRIRLSDKEKAVVERLAHPVYTVPYLEEYINREDNIFVNAPAALLSMGAHGYYQAIKAIAKEELEHG